MVSTPFKFTSFFPVWFFIFFVLRKYVFSGPCGYEEMEKIQAYLAPEYQLKVFSASRSKLISFQGKVPSAKVLHLYHDIDEDGNDGHFLVLTKVCPLTTPICLLLSFLQGMLWG